MWRRRLAYLIGVLVLVLVSVPPLEAQPRPQVLPLHAAEAGNVNGAIISTFGYPSVTVDNSIAAAWDGTLNYEVNFPSIGWVAVQCRNQATNLIVTTTTGAASVMCNITGAQQFRARVSGRTVGTVTATAAIMTSGESGMAAVPINDTLVDNAPFTDGTSRVFPAGFILDEVAGIALTENDVAAARVDSKRAQVIVIEDATTRGTRAAVTAAGLQVDTELPAAAALADAASATPTTPTVGVIPLLMNATTEDRARAVVNGLNSVGTGIAAAGAVAQFDDVAPTAITENQFGPLRMSTNRNLYTTLRDAAGNERGANVNASNELTVSSSVTAVVPGTGATNLGKAEDAAHVSGDTGVMALGVRNDTHTTALTSTDGDYSPLAVDSTGKLGIRGTYAEDAAHTSGDLGLFALAVRNDTHTTALSGTNGDYTPIGVDSTGKIGIRGTYAEDSGHTSGDLGILGLAVRSDTDTALAGTDLDYIPLSTNSAGHLRVVPVRFPAAAVIDTENTGLVADTLLEAATANMRLMSATAQENAATPANTFAILRHGVVGAGVCTGNVIAYIKLGPSQSWNMQWGSRGLAVASGVCLDWISGTIDVNIATVVEGAP